MDTNQPPPTDDPPDPQPQQPAKTSSRKWSKIILGGAVLGLTGILCFSIALYVILTQFKGQIVSSVAQVSSLTTADEPVLANEIAFIGNDRNIWVVSPDGENLRALTDNARVGLGYSIPTWSPDNRHVAFAGPLENRNIALFVSSRGSDVLEAPDVVYDTPNSAPFYLYWSPTSQDLTFLTQEQNGLSMRLAEIGQADTELAAPQAERVMERGSPFYWVWSPNGDKLVMHVGGARAISDEAHLSVLNSTEDPERVELQLAPGHFQAPFWSSDNKYLYYVAENDEGSDTVYRMDMTTLNQEQVVNLNGIGRTYMVASPNNKYMAYLEADLNRPIPIGVPQLVDLDTNETVAITNRSVISMYWSPDGTKIALLTVGFDDTGPSVKIGGKAAPLPQEQRVIFRWWVYDTTDKTVQALMTINPPAEFLQTVPYFDQYHLSLTFWSPDSRYFVVSSQEEEDDMAAIFIVDTQGEQEVRQIGQGRVAVWSWK